MDRLLYKCTKDKRTDQPQVVYNAARESEQEIARHDILKKTNEDTRARVEKSFRRLLDIEPYSKMTVAEICEGAHVSRKTFYTYFSDKEDVVSYIFKQHVIKPQQELNSLLDFDVAKKNRAIFHEKFYQSLLDDKDYYIKLVRPMHGQSYTFIHVVTEALYSLNMSLLPGFDYHEEPWEIEYRAYFLASSQATLMQKWIIDGMVVSPHDLGILYSKMTASFWKDFTNS